MMVMLTGMTVVALSDVDEMILPVADTKNHLFQSCDVCC